MSKTEQLLVKASAEINSLEAKVKKEHTEEVIQKIEASGFTIDDLLVQLKKNQNVEDKKEVE